MREHVRRSAAIGTQLYLLDKASAIGTDVLMARVPDFRNKNLAGYLPFREASDEDLRPKESWLVIFFTRDDPPRLAYQIRIKVEAKPDFESFDPPKPAPPALVRMFQARQIAVAALPSHPQPLNPVVMPAEVLGERGIMVYLIAGTDKPDIAVFGRHYRVLVPESGGPPSYVMPLSNTILELPIKPPKGAKPAGLMVTHPLTDWPLETHVFVSLLNRIPVYVATRVGLWEVDGHKIALIREDGAGNGK
jgi:hypothetical protein